MTFRRLEDKYAFSADYAVSTATYRADNLWARKYRRFVATNFTHALLESNVSLFGRGGGNSRKDTRALRRNGLIIGLLAHGSDVRIPSIHTLWEPWSPFPSLDQALVRKLEERARATADFFSSYVGPVFVSTPALLRFVPNAHWLPVVIDTQHWPVPIPKLSRERPVVVHAPSNSALKGSDQLDPVLRDLSSRGWIDYRRVENIPHAEMPEIYRKADVMVDLVGTANYGAAACEAMASGTLVLSHVSKFVRAEVRRQTGRGLPIIEATPKTLEAVVEKLLDDREAGRQLALRGATFAREVHSGRWSAQTLQTHLIGNRNSRLVGFAKSLRRSIRQ